MIPSYTRIIFAFRYLICIDFSSVGNLKRPFLEAFLRTYVGAPLTGLFCIITTTSTIIATSMTGLRFLYFSIHDRIDSDLNNEFFVLLKPCTKLFPDLEKLGLRRSPHF